MKKQCSNIRNELKCALHDPSKTDSPWDTFFLTNCKEHDTSFTPKFSEESGGLSQITPGPIIGIHCTGSFCDNKAFKYINSDLINSSGGTWTGWFSDETAGEHYCPSGKVVNQIECSGRYCDNMRLFC